MKKILLGLMLLASSTTFSQLDSVAVDLNFVSIPLSNEDSLTVQQVLFQVEIQVNDLNDLGAIVVKLSKNASEEPFSIFYASQADILANGLLINGKIVIPFPELDPALPYQVSVDIQNSSLAYLPLTLAYYQPN